MNTNDRFKQHMAGLREHHKAGASHTYSLPLDLIHPRIASAEPEKLSTEVKAEITAALKYCEQQMRGFLDEQQKATLGIVKLMSGKAGPALADTTSFIAKMEQLKAEAQQRAGHSIDQMYDKLIAVGEKHPPAQPSVLSNSQRIMAMQGNLLANLGGFYGSLGPAGMVVGGVITFFGDAGNAVGDFFSSIF